MGSEIFKEGDDGDGMYMLKEGSVEISVLFSSQSPHVFARVRPGEIFGEMAVIDEKPRSASAVAKAPSTVYFMPSRDVQPLIARSPSFAFGLDRKSVV